VSNMRANDLGDALGRPVLALHVGVARHRKLREPDTAARFDALAGRLLRVGVAQSIAAPGLQ